jgi:hypothetical protein
LEGEAAVDDFGWSVAISSTGRRVAIGALLTERGGKGRIYVNDYSDVANSWDPKGQVPDGINDGDGQGTSVDLSSDGNILAIGADEHDKNGSNSGMARVYELVGCCTWVQYGSTIYGEAAADQLGAGEISLSSDGNMLAVGATRNSNSIGMAYLFRFTDGDWKMIHNAPGNTAGDGFGISVNASGDGSLFDAGGLRILTSEDMPGYVNVYSADIVSI